MQIPAEIVEIAVCDRCRMAESLVLSHAIEEADITRWARAV